MRRTALILPLLLAACTADPEAPAGGFTADDQQQLNDAAEMLDANSIELNAVAPANATEAQP